MRMAAMVLLGVVFGLIWGVTLQMRADDKLATYAAVNHCAKGDARYKVNR